MLTHYQPMRLSRLNIQDARRHVPAAALLLVYSYLGFHAFSGSQGLVRWMDHAERSDHLRAELAQLESRRDALQDEVDRLSARSLDLDSLDIEARRVLFVAKPGETTIWLDQN